MEISDLKLEPPAKKLGRPRSGKALTPAQKQERYRNRKASQLAGVASSLRQLSELLLIPSPDLVERVQIGLLHLADDLDPSLSSAKSGAASPAHRISFIDPVNGDPGEADS